MAGDVTVVLVHGANCGAWVWKTVGSELDSRGIAHVEMDLPSVSPHVDSSVDVHTDAQYLREVLDGCDGPVVLCGNSYGGVVITEASAGHPLVRHLVYLAAFMPDADDEIISWAFGHLDPDPPPVVQREDGLIEVDPHRGKELLLQQSAPEVSDWAMSQLRPMSLGSGSSPTITGVGWREIPSTCIVCSEDLLIRPDSQRQWARERATESVEVPFDHLAPLSHPAEVAEILGRIASNLTNTLPRP
jgi:pimeloyl-ACP methyl ester carboxylesterase